MVINYIIYIRVPETEKDRRTRPYDNNSGITKIEGTLKYTGSNVHKKEKHENNHNLNVYASNCPEDLLHFWGVQNLGNASNVYFQEIDYNPALNQDIYPMKLTTQDVVNEQLVEDKLKPYYFTEKGLFGLGITSLFGFLICL